MTNLRKTLEAALKEYIRRFEKKHGLSFEHAVSDDLTGVICFGDVFFFHISDIIYDIDNKLPKGLIIDWLYSNLDNQDRYINLHSYAKGLRHE